jgi:hypothetical protein
VPDQALQQTLRPTEKMRARVDPQRSV